VDFDDTPEEAAFRAEVVAFLDAHARPRQPGVERTDGWSAMDGDVFVQRCRDWQRTLYDHGWAGITWPKEHGGRGGTAVQHSIFAEEQRRYDVAWSLFAVGIGMVGPTLIVHGTEEQKDRYLEPLLKGEEAWCQLFSEPGAGSDLASLSTRAVLDGDQYVVNGQKVWTSGAHHSDFGILLARTDRDVPKHAGISYFVLDMGSTGVEVRPLRQITGTAHFNEVFLTDVRIPVENLVGAVNDGWSVARTTMENERAVLGASAGSGTTFDDIAQLARDTGRTCDPVARQRLSDLYVQFEVLRFLRLRSQTATRQGKAPGPESSVLKLAFSRQMARSCNFVLTLSGTDGMLNGADARDNGRWQTEFLAQWGARIGGGTDEIQRNVIGERALGLPREPRA
jgi:alkylation response protein AidB-like acyl-CoA dehydrogenase